MQAIRGTKDIMSPEIYTWQYIEHIINILTNQFGYSEIRTPIFESIDVFKRTIGEKTQRHCHSSQLYQGQCVCIYKLPD